jgi:hypothetical protein
MSQKSKQRQQERDNKLGRQKPISAGFKRARRLEAEAKERAIKQELMEQKRKAIVAQALA